MGGAAEMGWLLCIPSTHPLLNGRHFSWFCGLTDMAALAAVSASMSLSVPTVPPEPR